MTDREAEAIRADLERAREDLGRTVHELQDRLARRRQSAAVDGRRAAVVVGIVVVLLLTRRAVRRSRAR